jgi:hypothetical protein
VSIVRNSNTVDWASSHITHYTDRTNSPTLFSPFVQYSTTAFINYYQHYGYTTDLYWAGNYTEGKIASQVDVTLSGIPTGTPFTVSVFLGGYPLATTNESGNFVLYLGDGTWADNAVVPTPGRMHLQYSSGSALVEHDFSAGNLDQPPSLSLVPAGPEDSQTTNGYWFGSSWYAIREFDFQYK